MGEKEESLENILIDEEEAKKEFLEELRTKNLEETRAFERAAIERALLEKAANDEKLKEEQKASVEVASGINEDKEENKDNGETQLVVGSETQLTNVEKKGCKGLLNTFKATVIDTAVPAVVSVAAVYLFDALIRLILGYYVVDFKGVYIIAFLIILVLYPVLMKKIKDGKTLGQKFCKLEVKEREE